MKRYKAGVFYKKKIILSGNPNDGKFEQQLVGQRLRFDAEVISKIQYQWNLVCELGERDVMTEYEFKLMFSRLFKKVKAHLFEYHAANPYKRQ